MDWTHNEQNTIDLTDDRHDHDRGQQPMRIALPPVLSGRFTDAPGPSSRTQRGPRFDRNIINLENSDEEDHTHTHTQYHTRNNPVPGQSAAQDEGSLFIPDTASAYLPFAAIGAQRRPTTSGLRPGYMRNYPTASEHDDVQVVASRSLSRHPSRRSTPALPMPDETTNNAGSATIDLTADDDDDVIHTRTRALPGINGDRPAMAGSGVGTRERPAFGIAHLAHAMRTHGGFDQFQGLDAANSDDAVARARVHQHQRLAMANLQEMRERRQVAEREVQERHGVQAQVRAATRLHNNPQLQQATRGIAMHARHQLRVHLDFNVAGFDMGLNEPARPATPKYEAPPPAEKGFTRSPEEDEEVVCPNCGDELAVSEDETKAQVWVIKTCGHVSRCYNTFTPPRNIKLTHDSRLIAANVPPARRCQPVERARAKQWTPAFRRRLRSASWWAARRASASSGSTSTSAAEESTAGHLHCHRQQATTVIALSIATRESRKVHKGTWYFGVSFWVVLEHTFRAKQGRSLVLWVWVLLSSEVFGCFRKWRDYCIRFGQSF
jgi:hypothetical protein